MSYQLLVNGFPAVSITGKSRLDHFSALKAYTVEDNSIPLAEMVTDLTGRQLGRCLNMMGPSQDIQQNPKV